MDTSVLVSQAQALTKELDKTAIAPQAVMWIRSEDTENWRLWIVPAYKVKDERDFYRQLARTLTDNSDKLSGLDVGMVEYVRPDHPAMRGMGQFLHMPGVGSVVFNGNRFNDYYLPEGIVIRMNLRAVA